MAISPPSSPPSRDASSKWFESASWISFSAINDPETAEYISKRCGDTTVEVRFKKEAMDLTADFVYLLFSSYREGAADLSLLKQREQAIEKRVKERLYGP